MELEKITSDIERNIHRDRWLMVKDQLGCLSPYDRDEVLKKIKNNSKRVTEEQLHYVYSICEKDDFLTVTHEVDLPKTTSSTLDEALDIKQISSDIERNMFRDRWLMVKDQLGDLTPIERNEVLTRIKEKSKRMTEDKLIKAQSLCKEGDFKTVNEDVSTISDDKAFSEPQNIKQIASAIELNIFRKRWLMVKAQLGELNPYEKIEVLNRIKEKSTRISEEQLLEAQAICNSGDFLTVIPKD